jgi:hypothetical protein
LITWQAHNNRINSNNFSFFIFIFGKNYFVNPQNVMRNLMASISVDNLKQQAMKKYFTILLLLTFGISRGQNLIPNDDFELYNSCPSGFAQIDSARFWRNPCIGTSTPDYFNQCSTAPTCVPNNGFGYQPAHSGVGYGGIDLYYIWNNNGREYLEVPLSKSLEANACYHFEMYVGLSDISQYTTDNIGVYFSNSFLVGINSSTIQTLMFQLNNSPNNYFDTANWVIVSGDYLALGGETHLLIGNQNYDYNTNRVFFNGAGIDLIYCYIDDVSLIKIESCFTGRNELSANSLINIYPNPVFNNLNIKASGIDVNELTLYDITSQKLLQHTFSNSTSINTERLAKGIYIYEVRNRNGLMQNGKIVKE